jgi:hypothetical protein
MYDRLGYISKESGRWLPSGRKKLFLPSFMNIPVFITRFCIQKYWDFGLCPSSGTLKTREHNVSGTGFVSIFR